MVVPARPMSERPAGRFHRRVRLTCDVEPDAIRAEARDGVLTVRLPKVAQDRTRQIPVQAS